MSDVSDSLSRTPDEQKTYDYYAGIGLAVAGAILLATSFMVRNPVPLTVRGAIVLFMAGGLAVTFGFLRVKNQQDFYGGMALVLLCADCLCRLERSARNARLCVRTRHGAPPVRFHARCPEPDCRGDGAHHPRPLCHEIQNSRRDLHHRLHLDVCRNDPLARSRHRELCNDRHLRRGGRGHVAGRKPCCGLLCSPPSAHSCSLTA